MLDQKKLIHDVVRGGSWIIIILDACRYDFFEKVYRGYLSGELLKVKSANSATPYWLRETWVAYYDCVYVSANPFIMPNPPEKTRRGDEVRKWLKGYEPAKHFKRIVPLYLTDWDEELGTVPPDRVVKRTLENLYPRMVVHFLQPHAPYIGKKKILAKDMRIAEKLRRGIITYEDVLEAYEENLRFVLEHVADLVTKVDHEVVVVTSDHGEMITPKWIEHPPDKFIPELIEVPWLWVRRKVSD